MDSILSCPGLLKPNRDILAYRRQRSGFRDRVSKTGTVPEKPGQLVSLYLLYSYFGQNWGCSLNRRSMMLESAKSKHLNIKLFSKYSNLCDHNTSTSWTAGQTNRKMDRRLAKKQYLCCVSSSVFLAAVSILVLVLVYSTKSVDF